MQYCSLQHQTLLPSTADCCFCFGSISSFFLELYLHSSPVAYWAPTDLGNSSFSVKSFCLFILFAFSWSSQGKNAEVVCHSLSSEPHFVRTLHHDLSREGNGNPLQCSCLENPRDRGTWWTSVYGVAQSRTRLMRLSSSSSSSSREGDGKDASITTAWVSWGCLEAALAKFHRFKDASAFRLPCCCCC